MGGAYGHTAYPCTFHCKQLQCEERQIFPQEMLELKEMSQYFEKQCRERGLTYSIKNKQQETKLDKTTILYKNVKHIER